MGVGIHAIQPSPCSTLPQNVLRQIFSACCRGIERIYVEDNAPPLHQTLSKVCRRWNQVVHTSPSLWQSIGINFNDPSMHGTTFLEMHTRRLDRCLVMSGCLGLHIQLCYNERLREDVPPFLEVAIHMLGEHSDRWETVEAKPANSTFFRELFESASNGLASLTNLKLDFDHRREPFQKNAVAWTEATRLRLISIFGAKLDGASQPHFEHAMPWWQMTELTLHSVEIPHRNLRQMLVRMPCLEDLYLLHLTVLSPVQASTPVHLPHLRRLLVREHPMTPHVRMLYPILDLLNPPLLQYIAVGVPSSIVAAAGPVAACVIAFILRTGCKLLALDTDLVPWPDVRALLLAIPTLTRIKITATDIAPLYGPILSEFLTPTFTLDGMHIPLPDLQFLSVMDLFSSPALVQGDRRPLVPLENFIEMLEHRVRGSPSLSVYGLAPLDALHISVVRQKNPAWNLEAPDAYRRPEILVPLLDFCKRHRLRTLVEIFVQGPQFDESGRMTPHLVPLDKCKRTCAGDPTKVYTSLVD